MVKESINNWRTVFNIVGWLLIVLAIINLVVSFFNGDFSLPASTYSQYEEVKFSLVWAYITTSTLPTIISGVGCLFFSDLLLLLIDFYDTVCNIENIQKQKRTLNK